MRHASIIVLSLVPMGCTQLSVPPAKLPDQGTSQITEVNFRRIGCYGTCPQYKASLRRDGTASYSGYASVKRLGRYQGRVAARDFSSLTNLMEQHGVFQLKDNYARPVDDLAAVRISIVRGSQRKTIYHYGGDDFAPRDDPPGNYPQDEAPTNLVAIEKAIDAALEKVHWEKTEPGGHKAPAAVKSHTG